MQMKSSHVNPETKGRRERLTEIVSEMGEDATPAEIREKAYAVGFGKVSSPMLVHIRNELWPNRRREKSGNIKGWIKTYPFSVPDDLFGIPKCPECKSPDTKVIGEKRVQEDGSCIRRRKCKSCNQLFITEGEPIDIEISSRRLMAISATEKQCSKCKMFKPVAEFGKKSGDSQLYRSSCRACQNKARSRSYISSQYSQYGMTLEKYEALLRTQNELCAICGHPDRMKIKKRKKQMPLCIDHCHKRNVVRGLLCSKCNLGIGNFDDVPERLEAAAAYIRSFNSQREAG